MPYNRFLEARVYSNIPKIWLFLAKGGKIMKFNFPRKQKATPKSVKSGTDSLGLFRKSKTITGKGNGVRGRGR